MTQLKTQVSSIKQILPSLKAQEVKIYDAYKKYTKIQDFKVGTNEYNVLLATLGKWAIYIGVSDNVSDKELQLNAEFISENFGRLNIEDINQVINMVTNKSLETQAQHYGKMSPMYIGQVLNDYKKHRSAIITDCNAKYSKYKMEQSLPKPSKEESISNLKILITDAWQRVCFDKLTYDDYGDVLYNFIKRNKLIAVDKKLIEEAMNFAKKNVIEENRENALQQTIMNMPFNKHNQEVRIKKKSRQFVVNKWIGLFSKKEIDEFLKKMDFD